MPDISDLFESFISVLPKLNWNGTHKIGDEAETPLSEIEAKAGTDLARGPWVKFNFTRANGNKGSVQGYWLYKGGERVKEDGHIEAANDDVRVIGGGANIVVQFSGQYESGPNNGKTFLYRFTPRL